MLVTAEVLSLIAILFLVVSSLSSLGHYHDSFPLCFVKACVINVKRFMSPTFLFAQGVTSVAVLADGRVVSGSSDETVRVWNLATGACDNVLEWHTSVSGCAWLCLCSSYLLPC